jgi:hypothetical protein
MDDITMSKNGIEVDDRVKEKERDEANFPTVAKKILLKMSMES